MFFKFTEMIRFRLGKVLPGNPLHFLLSSSTIKKRTQRSNFTETNKRGNYNLFSNVVRNDNTDAIMIRGSLVTNTDAIRIKEKKFGCS